MPFDGMTPEISLHDRATALVLDRRERAAALWRSIPNEQFDISHWCGTAACALGWLAAKRVDGWEPGRFFLIPHRRGDHDPLGDARDYFGLPPEQVKMFQKDDEGYGVTDLRLITGAMVADRLMATPIVLHQAILEETAALAAI